MGKSTYLKALLSMLDNENIFISADKGMTWEHFMNVRDLAIIIS